MPGSTDDDPTPPSGGRHRGPDRPDVALRFGGPTRRPQRRRTRRNRRRLLGLGLIGVGVAVLACFAWLAFTGLKARTELADVRAGLGRLRTQLTTGDVAGARRTAADVAAHARRAHDLTTGPVWAIAAHLPAGGAPIETVRGLAAAVDDLAHGTLPDLVSAGSSLDPATLRGAGGTLDVARISAAAPLLDRASADLSSQLAAIRALPAQSWLPAVDDARAKGLAELDGIDGTVRSVDLAARILPDLLGAQGTRRYFVGFQNNAEARGTGGLPGAFGILAADHGRLRFERFESDNALDGVSAKLELGADYDQLYAGARTTELYVNSNLGPNFPYAARIWTDMWQRRTGQRLDGAIALDPTALSYLLGASGPATLADGATITAGNVVELTQSTAYRTFGDRVAARRAYLRAVAKAASESVVTSTGSPRGLLDAARRAADERRLLVWTSDPALEALLARSAVGGQIPDTSQPYAGLSVVNDGGDKLDYYLDRSVRWQRTGCGATRDVTVTITLTNGAPTGLPRSVTDRSDVRGYRIAAGDNRVEVSWYATSGAQLRSVDLDGSAAAAHVGAERGHPVYTVDVELPRTRTRTVTLHLSEPAGTAPVTVLRQPLVRPLSVAVSDADCR